MSTKPKVVMTDFGPVTEETRWWIVHNLKADPVRRQEVLDLLCKKMGGVAKGEMEMRARYPELFEEENQTEETT